MADYQMAFILTDSEMKKSSADSDEKEIVKRENLTPDMMASVSVLLLQTIIFSILANPSFLTLPSTDTSKIFCAVKLSPTV